MSTWLQSDEAIRRAISAFPQDFWDFAKENTKEWTHGYHGYPAMMIPQVARHLIALVKTHAPDTERLFDPFMGSGGGYATRTHGDGIGLEPSGQASSPRENHAL